MMFRIGLIVAASLFYFGLPAKADIDPCDTLAANPPDPDRVTEGISRSAMDLDAAIEACRAATEREPNEPRFAYQLGRALFYTGDINAALDYFGRAVDLGYRQAEFVMGAVINNRREGVPYDVCKIEEYWLSSARKEHLHARISYVRHLTKGYFENCEIGASDDEIRQFIDLNPTGSNSYFQRLLVEDLKEDVNRYLSDEN